MSNAIVHNNKYKIITFSIVNNPYPCHPSMFITENYSSKFTIMPLWAPALKLSGENVIPRKSLDASLRWFSGMKFIAYCLIMWPLVFVMFC